VNARVSVGDELAMEIGDLPNGHIVPMPFPLDVRFEDEDLLVIDKPAGSPSISRRAIRTNARWKTRCAPTSAATSRPIL
jgi:23S rRNA-/tRNA-specific pseudouridylate synthase